jgi:hypothetical protein
MSDEPSVESLMAEAERRTGLSDWGDHLSFRSGLGVLLASVAESELPGETRAELVQWWTSYLEQRLRLIEHRRRNPAVAEERIERPLIVIGLPRTGTTALVDLLALDPASRSPLQWEADKLPWPPPTREGWATDPRIDEAKRRDEQFARENPLMAAQHTMSPMLPTECNAILMIDFWSPSYAARYTLPRHDQWLAHSRIERPYRTHRRILQHLQHHGPLGRWTLKSPFHQFDLVGLLDEYPDAMLVHTHRDPVSTLPSQASLIAARRKWPAGDPRRRELGPLQLDLWGTGIRRGTAARCDPAVDSHVYDLSNRTLAGDPLGAVRDLYEHFELPFTEEYATRIKDWIERPTQPSPRGGYSLEEHGLDVASIEEAFTEYRTRFAHYL